MVSVYHNSIIVNIVYERRYIYKAMNLQRAKDKKSVRFNEYFLKQQTNFWSTRNPNEHKQLKSSSFQRVPMSGPKKKIITSNGNKTKASN